MATAALAALYLYRRFLDQSLAAQERAHQDVNAALRADPAFQAARQAREDALRFRSAYRNGEEMRPVGQVVPLHANTTANGHQDYPEPEPEEQAFQPLPDTPEPEPDFDATRPIAPDTPGPLGDDAA